MISDVKLLLINFSNCSHLYLNASQFCYSLRTVFVNCASKEVTKIRCPGFISVGGQAIIYMNHNLCVLHVRQGQQL
jgi:hypothetical protein